MGTRSPASGPGVVLDALLVEDPREVQLERSAGARLASIGHRLGHREEGVDGRKAGRDERQGVGRLDDAKESVLAAVAADHPLVDRLPATGPAARGLVGELASGGEGVHPGLG
jgi:hypothetical protein